jgi:dihydroneopterin aldolase
MNRIEVKGIRLYAHHGCLEEEAAIGSHYEVDVWVDAHLEPSVVSDQLADTVDYVHLNRVVKEEMAIRSKLLEHVGGRIIRRIFSELPAVAAVRLRVCKLNPPINGDVERVCVILERAANVD